MTPLSELVKQHRPFARPSAVEPVETSRAAQSIRRRWPDVDTMDPEADPVALASEMDRRRRRGDWQDFHWLDATRTACALLDNGLWEDPQFAPLFEFLLDQIGPGDRPANGTYVRTMFRKYLDTFASSSEATHRLASALKVHWPKVGLPIRALVHQFRIFDVDSAPAQAIAAYMDKQDKPFEALRKVGMEAPHGAGLMSAAHLHFIDKLRPRVNREDLFAVEKLLEWLQPPNHGLALQGKGAGAALEALLLPWRMRNPTPELKRLLEARLVSTYGDPRINTAGVWSTCSDETRRVMLKWLCAATMELFFEIITQAEASHMWADRKGLWMDLHKQDRITQAWFALSHECIAIADRLDRRPAGLEPTFARNNSGSQGGDRKKTLLIMEIEGRWVVEGSHNFPTHIFPRTSMGTSIKAFKPYRNSYTCDQFRNIRGPEQPQQIWHRKNWRNKVLMELLG